MGQLKTLKKVLQFKQSELKEFCKEKLIEAKYDICEGTGFLFGKGDIPILLVAHLDTVHIEPPRQIYFDKEQTTLWSPQGIGGDDRCGVYMILRILSKLRPYVLFTEDEEIGAKGATNAIAMLKQPEVKFIIELDRRGQTDCVFYECGNKDFKNYIESFGFIEKIGSFSDISVLADEWDIASVNLSSGYHNEHTTKEIINLQDMNRTFKKVVKILQDDDERYFDHQTERYTYTPYKTTYPKKDGVIYQDQWGYIDMNDEWHWWDSETKEKFAD